LRTRSIKRWEGDLDHARLRQELAGASRRPAAAAEPVPAPPRERVQL
jgi:hypothetical protein